MKGNDLSYEFKLFRLTRNGEGSNHRLNKDALHHIVTTLLPYYPQLGQMKSGERADFVLFLFEKALKGKLPDYVTSWEAASTGKNTETNPIF